jgi:DNA-binding beta-propeller fold protein YncE
VLSRAGVSRRYVLATASVLCVLAGGLFFSPAPALAASEYKKVASIETGSGPWGLAVDQTSGDVLVAELGVVQAFTPVSRPSPQAGYTEGLSLTGFSATFGVGVDDSGDLSQGDVYVADRGAEAIDKFNSLGMPVEVDPPSNTTNQFGAGAEPKLAEPSDAAVDPADGDVYVADESGGEGGVDVYTSLGEFTGVQFSTKGQEPTGLAFNSSGSDLYVVARGTVEELTALGAEVEQTAGPCAGTRFVDCGGSATAVAVDPSTNDVYIAEEGKETVAVYEATGARANPAEFATGIGFARGLAVDGTTHDVYVSETSGNGKTVDVFQPVTLPTVVTEPASSVAASSATLNGTINPESETLPATWQFQCEGGLNVPASPVSVGTGTSEISVTADLSGLTPDTEYSCRLVGSNTSSSEHADGAYVSFATLGPPSAAGESFSEVGATTATVSAVVNTEGSPSEYRFEYGPSASYGSATPWTSFGSERGGVEVHAQLSGLQPGTTYHFRVLAKNVYGEAPGADTMFTTVSQSAFTLPDGRVYEMVTPAQNHNASVEEPDSNPSEIGDTNSTNFLPYQAAADGDAIAYVGETNGTGSGTVNGNEYLATRSPAGGWTQIALQPPGYIQTRYDAFSDDLSLAILDGGFGPADASLPTLAPGAPGEGYDVLYACTVSEGGCSLGEGATPSAGNPFRTLFTTTPPNRPAGDFELGFRAVGFAAGGGERLAYAGASGDLSHLLFEANDDLLSGGSRLQTELGDDVGREISEGKEGNDLYDSVAGQLSLVNVLPSGTAAPEATFGSPQPEGGLPDFSHVISVDGSRIFWTDLDAGADMEHVYVRENDEKTIAVSEGPARFWTATPDGRYAYYTEGEKLWRFDVEGETREEIAGGGAGVQGVIGVNEEGEDSAYLYFVANGVLAAKATPGDCEVGEDPTCNLYVRHNGATTFIATLSEADDHDNNGSVAGEDVGDWQRDLGFRTAELTPDGHSVVFESVRNLTSYDSDGLSEVFVYDADLDHIFCASCNPTGEPPLSEFSAGAPYLPQSTIATYIPRWISGDGRRVFFDSAEPLLPQASNGHQNVYEWERYEPESSTDSCTNAPSESASENLSKREKGCIYLLSGATSTDNSYLLDASTSGNDVFFVSRARLVTQDDNSNFNLFDARVGGVQPTASACSGTGCQGVPPERPIFETPASATFSGVGNFGPSPPVPAVKPKTKPLTRSQKLAKALKTCKGKRNKRKRVVCETLARKRYGAKAKKSSKGGR